MTAQSHTVLLLLGLDGPDLIVGPEGLEVVALVREMDACDELLRELGSLLGTESDGPGKVGRAHLVNSVLQLRQTIHCRRGCWSAFDGVVGGWTSFG